jgi:hypothetical protein
MEIWELVIGRENGNSGCGGEVVVVVEVVGQLAYRLCNHNSCCSPSVSMPQFLNNLFKSKNRASISVLSVPVVSIQPADTCFSLGGHLDSIGRFWLERWYRESTCRGRVSPNYSLLSCDRAFYSPSVVGDCASRNSVPKPPLTLQNVHDDAIKQLQDAGRLSPDGYRRIEGTTLQDILVAVDTVVTRTTNVTRIGGVFKSLLERLGKFEAAIDMLAQSSPQVLGLSLVGLIWGSLKILLVVSSFLIWLLTSL